MLLKYSLFLCLVFLILQTNSPFYERLFCIKDKHRIVNQSRITITCTYCQAIHFLGLLHTFHMVELG